MAENTLHGNVCEAHVKRRATHRLVDEIDAVCCEFDEPAGLRGRRTPKGIHVSAQHRGFLFCS